MVRTTTLFSWILIVCLGATLYVTWFELTFFERKLYNSAPKAENRITRQDVLEGAYRPTDVENPFTYTSLRDKLRHTENLRQRVPASLAALGILATGILLGDLLLRAAKARLPGNFERLIYAYGLGLGAVSLLTQLLGLLGLLKPWIFIACAMVALLTWLLQLRRTSLIERPMVVFEPSTSTLGKSSLLAVAATLAMLPYLAISYLSAALPTPDYDAIAYHLLAPKEYFVSGSIHFLPHNVYSTFPFLTEMFALAGMVVNDSWFVGALTGQLVIWSFTIATSAAIGLLAAKSFGTNAGWLAALAYCTSPWTYRLGSIPYVEGPMNFYLAAALCVASSNTLGSSSRSLIGGMLAGCAFSCKYTAALMVVPVVGVYLIAKSIRVAVTVAGRESVGEFARLLPFAVGFFLFAGIWLVRNLLWTGDPMFPLFSHVDSAIWSSALAEKFLRGHRSTDFGISSLFEQFRFLTLDSDWQSGLYFAFAPLALIGRRWGRATAFWLTAAFLFLAFWRFTHRLDRFVLTTAPILAVLAGGGMTAIRHWTWRIVVFGVIVLNLAYQFPYCFSLLCGLEQYTQDLKVQQWKNMLAKSNRSIFIANTAKEIPPDANILFVGFGGLFDARPPFRYNTVFNESIFEQIARKPDSKDARLPAEVAARLREQGIRFVIVDWSWIRTYQDPTNYGYSDFIRPAVFEGLKNAGALKKVELIWPDFVRPEVLQELIRLEVIDPRQLMRLQIYDPDIEVFEVPAAESKP